MAGRKAGFASKQFEKQFHYGKSDLGAMLTREGTEFRLWAPTAERVELRLPALAGKELYNPLTGANGRADGQGRARLEVAPGEMELFEVR